jgi:predicted component of type VI protein secretion system
MVWYNNMAEEDGQEVRVEPDDPEFQLEEHIAFKRRQEALTAQLRRLCQENLSEFLPTMDASAFAFTRLSLPNKGLPALTELVAEYPHLRYSLCNSAPLT